MKAMTTNLVTADGLTVYDLDPQASELWAVAGPAGFDPKSINPDKLPEGFRWVESDEWADLQLDVDAQPRTLALAGEPARAMIR